MVKLKIKQQTQIKDGQVRLGLIFYGKIMREKPQPTLKRQIKACIKNNNQTRDGDIL